MKIRKVIMAERVTVYQDNLFQTTFSASDLNDESTGRVENVIQLHHLTPYGMLLASLGSCTAIVVNTYARNHQIPLKGVTVDVTYDRVFAKDCEDCDADNTYEEIIKEKIQFEGDLDENHLKRLHQIAKACSVRRLLENGIRVESN